MDELEIEVLKHLVNRGMSQKEIADEMDTSQSAISANIRENGIEYENKDERKGH